MTDGRQHKVPVSRHELVAGESGSFGQLVWRLTLPCGHTVTRVGGRVARAGEYRPRTINGIEYVGVPTRVACDVCLGRTMKRDR